MSGRYWPLLLPAAYLLHMAEEVWGGPGFVAWAARHLSGDFSQGRFLLINGLAWPAMLAATLAGIHRPGLRWMIPAVAVVLLVNGVLHVGSSLATASYSPGTVSGALLYLPLGTLALRRTLSGAPPGTAPLAVGTGVAVHALVAFLAFGIDRL